jgi:addiction module HigA family antidote
MADSPPAHPGVTLREDFLTRLKFSPSALARAIGVPKLQIEEIVKGNQSIDPEMALRLARYFGTSAEFWIGLQLSHDLEMARERLGAEIKAHIRPRAAAGDGWP